MSAHTSQPAEKPTDTENSALCDVKDITSQEFDYVVVGGGTAGMALASRLAEDPNVTVALLEAGGEMHKYPSIVMPAQYGREHENPVLVYSSKTTTQESLGRPLEVNRGRGLGGTSAINFMTFQKPQASDINAWEKLGSPGWNWARYDAAVKRVETFHPPSKDTQINDYLEYKTESFGQNGLLNDDRASTMDVNLAEFPPLNPLGRSSARKWWNLRQRFH